VRCVLTSEPVPPRVAFAIGRGVGNAVRRNRVRRRLRAAARACTDQLVAGGIYLVEARPTAADFTTSELSDTLGEILGSMEAGAA
jgi:ribonuclease P protein component